MGRTKHMVRHGHGQIFNTSKNNMTGIPNQQAISKTNQTLCSFEEPAILGLVVQKQINQLCNKSDIYLTEDMVEIEPLRTRITCLTDSPTIMFMCNFNYMTSIIPDTYIKLEFSWETCECKKIFAEAKLGTTTAVIINTSYSYSNILNINSSAQKNITFTARAKYVSNSTLEEGEEVLAPQLSLSRLGSNVTLLELNDNANL